MKKLFTSFFVLISLILTEKINAQPGVIANNSFENWEEFDPSIPFKSPVGWLTTDLIYFFAFDKIENAMVQSTEKNKGDYSLKMRKTITEIELAGVVLKDTLNSVALLFDLVEETHGVFTKNRPSAVKGFYKYNNPDKDTSFILATASSFDVSANSSIDVGLGFLQFTSTNKFIPFTVPITYDPTQNGIDTLDITIILGSENNKSYKTELWIDDLELQWAVNSNEFDEVPITIYPNPAIEFISFDLTAIPSSSEILIFDMNGNMVRKEQIIDSIFRTNVSEFSKGNYSYSIFDKNNQRLKSGKISIMR